jgi:hypothetical protein
MERALRRTLKARKRERSWSLDFCCHPGFSNGTGFQAYIGDTTDSFRHLKIGLRSGSFAVLETSSGLKGRYNLAQGRAQGQGPAAPPWVAIPMNHRRPKGRDNPDERCVAPLQGAISWAAHDPGRCSGLRPLFCPGLFYLALSGQFSSRISATQYISWTKKAKMFW